jgi:hypothetical protein
MRRCTLRGRENILKRLLIHVGTFNLSLLLRKMLGAGTPRELKNRAASLVLRFFEWLACRYRPNGTVEFSITPVLTSPPPTAPADHDVSPSGIQPLAPRADSPTASATPEASFKTAPREISRKPVRRCRGSPDRVLSFQSTDPSEPVIDAAENRVNERIGCSCRLTPHFRGRGPDPLKIVPKSRLVGSP